MKILVIDKSIIRGRLTNTSGSLLKHLLFWCKDYNQVDLLARPDNVVLKKLKGKVNILRLPYFSFLGLLHSYFHLIFRSKDYDLVIEVWENRPLLCFVFNRQRSLVTIFANNFKNVLPGKIMSRLYRKTKFLVNSYSVKGKLIRAGVKKDNINFIPDGIVNKNNLSGEASFKKKNRILIVCGKNFKSTFSVISLIERKSLDWKFVIMTDKKYIQKLKGFYGTSKLTSGLKIIPLCDPTFDINVSNAKFLLITQDVKKVSDLVTTAFLKQTPVIIEGGFRDLSEKKICNLVLSYNNPMNISEKVLSLSKNASEYARLQTNISKTLKSHTWEEVGDLSLSYLESL
jgi:hypothetical protein